MANFQGTQAALAAFTPVPSADKAVDLIPVFGEITVPTGAASGDIIEAIPYPANHVLVDLIVDTEAEGTTMTADVGIMSGSWGQTGVRTMGSEFMTGKTFQTAGIYRADKAGATRTTPSTTDRSIGVKWTTVSTPTVGAKARITGLFRPMIDGA